jgi:hypothetical protein
VSDRRHRREKIPLYVDLLIKTREILMTLKEAFGKGQQSQRDFRDLAVLQPPLVYPVAADRLGLVRRPRAADVVEFYATIERVNFSVRAMSNEPTEKVSLSTCSRQPVERACRCFPSFPSTNATPISERRLRNGTPTVRRSVDARMIRIAISAEGHCQGK